MNRKTVYINRTSWNNELLNFVYLKIGVLLSRKSDARSIMTGSSVSSSSSCLVAIAEWKLVPQAIINNLRKLILC